jgi:hypothetical protein
MGLWDAVIIVSLFSVLVIVTDEIIHTRRRKKKRRERGALAACASPPRRAWIGRQNAATVPDGLPPSGGSTRMGSTSRPKRCGRERPVIGSCAGLTQAGDADAEDDE